jgi:histone H3/H4
VRAGKVSDVSVLELEFAKTHEVLATYFQSRSKRSFSKKAKDEAAAAMSAAANHIEATAKWSGQKLSSGGKETISLLRNTSNAIIKGVDKAVEKSGDALKSGKKLIKELGKKIEEEANENTKKAKRIGRKIKGIGL